MITAKEARYIVARCNGESKQKAALTAGFNPGVALNPQRIESPEVLAKIDEYQAELVNHALQVGLIDAKELHEQLTDELRGDSSDLYDEQNQLKPMKDWPLWARQGGVEILDEPNMVHSADGGEGSWDQIGRRIKVKFPTKHKTRELAMKHVAVRAMMETGSVNLTVNNITIEQRIAQARQRLLQAKSNGDSLLESKDDKIRSVNELGTKDESAS